MLRRQVDFDGKETLSKMVTIGLGKNGNAVKVYPNPAKENLTIDLGTADNATIRLVDISGKEMMLKTGLSGVLTLDIAHLASGVYFAEINAQAKMTREKIVKN